MERWGAVREGSSSSELPLFPPSPKPPPQAPRPLRPPIPPCQAALPLPRVQPHLTPGNGPGRGRVAGTRHWRPSGLGQRPAGTYSSRGQTSSELGGSLNTRRARAGLRGCLGSGWRPADAARPPGGARVRLGGLPRPAPSRPRPGMAPPPVRRRSRALIDAGTRRAGPQLPRGGRDGTQSRRESPLEGDSAPSGDCRCVAGARGRGVHA